MLQVMVEQRVSAVNAMDRLGIEQVDQSALVDLCRKLLEENPRVVDDVRGGKLQAVGALIGKARKQNPNVNPAEVRETCLKLIAEGDASL